VALGPSVVAAPQAIPKEMASLFPIGRTFNGVKIPSYTDDVLKTILEADTITRVDQTYLDLTKLVIKVYNPKGGIESTVKMDEARYHLVTGQLLSKTPARVDHEKFVMTGNRMGYDTASDVSTMTGNVKVVIPKAREFTGNFGMNAMGGE
jgi:lipopolysaccharide export system protein LptC